MLCTLYQADNEHTTGEDSWRGHRGQAGVDIGPYRWYREWRVYGQPIHVERVAGETVSHTDEAIHPKLPISKSDGHFKSVLAPAR